MLSSLSVFASALLLAVVVVVSGSDGQPTELSYQVGQELSFFVNGSVDARGQQWQDESRTSGSLGLLTGELVTQCTQTNSSGFLFVFNMFNVEVAVSQGLAVDRAKAMQSLGENMYYYQNKDGQILEVWYDANDSPYYVNVKLGALNAFQTQMLKVDQQMTIVENSPVGQVRTNYLGTAASAGALATNKTFNENDVLQFHNPNVTPKNMAYAAAGHARINAQGFIEFATVDQLSVLKDASPSSSTFARRHHAKGPAKAPVGDSDDSGLNMYLSSRGLLEHQLSSNKMVSATAPSRLVGKLHSSREALAASTLTSGSMFDLARAILLKNPIAELADVERSKEVLAQLHNIPAAKTALAARLATKATALLKALPQETRSKLLFPYFRTIDTMGRFVRARLLRVAVGADAMDLVSSFGLSSSSPSVAISSLMSLHWKKGGVKGALLDQVLALARSPDPQIAHVASLLFTQSRVSAVADSNFPFNRSVDKQMSVGGSTLGIDFDGSLFAGTNFNCNQPSFNFEAQADLVGNAHFMGMQAKAFEALAVYGQQNGSPLADDIEVTVFGKQVYKKGFPTLDCKGNTYEIAHSAPGFDLSYTVWVSIIPITFTVGANLDLDLKWQWQICPMQLTADVALLPSAGFTFSGGADIDLLLLKAGISLDAGLNSVVKPELFVTGSECEVGFNITQTNTPMDADFEAYYEWKHCKFLIFDCHWGTHNTHTLWSWSRPSSTTQLLSEEWKIAQ